MELQSSAFTNITEIHEELGRRCGSKIRLRADLGRSRIFEREGTLVSAHRSLFMIEIEERRGRITRRSYQYADVLTGMVELFEIGSEESLFTCAPQQLEPAFSE